MKLDIDQYISEEEKSKIAVEVFKNQVRHYFKEEADVKRILSNISYDIVYKMVDESLDSDMTDFMAKKVKETIEELSPFTLFKKPDAWDKESNAAYNHLQECVAENFPLIKKIVDENVEKTTLEELKENINNYIREAIERLYSEV